MKKVLVFLFLLIFIFAFSSCVEKTQNTNPPEDKTVYTKEFSYLPAYPGMSLQKAPETKDAGFSIASYVIKSAKIDNVSNDYEKLLNDKGWKTTENTKPVTFTVEKETHKVTILLSQEKDDTVMYVYAK